MKVLPVLKWMLFIALATVVAVGAGGIWLWQNGNGMIRQKVFQAFDKVAPQLELHFDTLEFVSTSTLKLTGVELRDRITNRPILRAAELQASVDEAQLVDRQHVLIRSVKISNVDILLRRFSDGHWNWQNYRFEKQEDVPFIPPSIIVENVRVQLQLEHEDGIPPASLIVSTPLFQAIPNSGDAYDFAGLVSLPGAGNLSLTGKCDLKTRLFQLGGQLKNVTADQSLVELAKSTAPQLAERLQQIDAMMVNVLPKPTRAQTASAEQGSAALVIGASGVSPRFLGILDVDFNIENRADASVPELRLKVDIRDGQLSSPVIPIHLTDVRAMFFWSNSAVVFRLINARDAEALITGELTMPLGQTAAASEAKVHLEAFPISSELKPLLPEKSQKIFDHFRPVGTVSGDIHLKRFPSGQWLPVNINGTADGASIIFHKFRYPVTGISATMNQRPMSETASSLNDVIFDITANGKLGDRVVTTSGALRNPGPALEMQFDVHVDGLPLDSRFRDALDEKGRKVIETINISGVATADVRCNRNPGLDQPTDIVISADVTEAKMRFAGFEYDIERLTGHVDFNSQEKSWAFQNLHGWHGPGELKANGTFRGIPDPGELKLTIAAEGAKLDSDLFNALNDTSRGLWTVLNPEGSVSLTTEIHWTAQRGQKPVVTLKDVNLFDATIYPKPFPYRMNIKSAKLSYDPNDPRAAGMQHCDIHSLDAEHDGSQITGSGWAEAGADGSWQLHLDDLNAIDLKPDDSLRAALPDGWRETLSRLAQNGLVSLESSQLDFRGVTNNQAPTTAAWDLNMRLKNCAAMTGLELKNVSGLVKAQGAWDGYQLLNKGMIRLDQIEVLDMVIAGINGPYTMTDDELVLGCRDVIQGVVPPTSVASEERVRGQAYGGTLEMDGLVDLKAGSNYRFFGELKSALLERYAAQHIPDQPNLRGVVNSWIFVTGDGDSSSNLTGKGQLLINPAALYEVPVILEMFSALSKLNFAVPNRTAFDYALMSFQIHDQAFHFDPIDLAGDALALRGRGSVGFGGDVVLDFFSRPAPARGPRIPLTRIMMASATQWVNVQVRGTVNRPQTTTGSKIKLDDSMRQFLGTFEPRAGGPIPSLAVPNRFGLPTPQARRP